MHGTYSTVKNAKGQLDLEISMTLESPPQVLNEVYMMWFQVLDPRETEAIQRDYFESFSCSFLFTDTIVSEGVHIQNSAIYGYRGELLFKDAVGRFDKLLAMEKSTTYPWFLDYKRSKVVQIQ